MPTFTITGNNCDEVSAKLKATLEADNARFNANLNALFKSPTPSKSAVETARSGPLLGPAPEAGCRLSSNRNDDDSLRGRMRTSLRGKASR